MTNSRAKGLQLIEKHTSPSTFTTRTFTLNDDYTNTTSYILYITGETTASLEVQMVLNGLATSTYYEDGSIIGSGVETLINIAAEEYSIVCDAIAAADRKFSSKIEITLQGDRLFWNMETTEGTASKEHIGGTNTTAVTQLASILIRVSTSSLKTGATLALYRIKK